MLLGKKACLVNTVVSCLKDKKARSKGEKIMGTVSKFSQSNNTNVPLCLLYACHAV